MTLGAMSASPSDADRTAWARRSGLPARMQGVPFPEEALEVMVGEHHAVQGGSELGIPCGWMSTGAAERTNRLCGWSCPLQERSSPVWGPVMPPSCGTLVTQALPEPLAGAEEWSEP